MPDDHLREQTPRSKERSQEDEQFVPVIVKRTDASRRHPDDILERAVKEGAEQLLRPALPLVLSAVAAGLIVGFSAMAAAIAADLTLELGAPQLLRVTTALVYPVGFIMCILSGTQLFTEHTATAVYPVLDGRAGAGRLLRLWAIVVFGNLVGAAGMASLLWLSEPVIGAAAGYRELARHIVDARFEALWGSTILAGWLMAQGAWLVLGATSTSGQILSIAVVTSLIGLGRLHHSIAGAAEVFAAYFVTDTMQLAAIARFLAVALCGNLIGGGVFVAILNYVHIRAAEATPDQSSAPGPPTGSRTPRSIRSSMRHDESR